MTDIEIATLAAGMLTAAGGGVIGLGKWLGGVWREVRREEIAAAKETAAAARAENSRTLDVIVQQAQAATLLAAEVRAIPSAVAAMLWHEHTPVEGVPAYASPDPSRGGRPASSPSDPPSERTRAADFPGYRSPRPGRRNDS